tara:strand:+ start:251 stop:448 length:198 start_codon:yes stop_codon:yes gene_type:complete
MEETNEVERSEIWYKIFEEVKQLPIDAKGMDAPDSFSVTTKIEDLFFKLLPIHGVVNCKNCEDDK